MRLYSLGLFAFVCASPAVAQDREAPRPAPDAAQVGALLSNPAVQEGVAATVDQFADALLQTHVGPLARYTDRRDGIRPEDSLGDLAARDNPNYRRDLHDSARGAIAATGQAARDLASLSTELRAATERMRRVIDHAQAELDATR